MSELVTLHPVYHRLLPGTGSEGIPEIQTTRKPDFSPNLRGLVRECLRPLPNRRPTISELLKRINFCREGIRKYFEPIRGPDESIAHDFERVFYRGNEIEQMPTGEWEPSRTAAAMNPNEAETGFPDLSAGSLHFPKWPTFHSTKSDEVETEAGGVQTRPEPRSMDGEAAEDDEDEEEDDEDEDIDEGGEGEANPGDYSMEPEDEDEDGDVVMGEDEDNQDEDPLLRPLSSEAKGQLNKFGRFRMI